MTECSGKEADEVEAGGAEAKGELTHRRGRRGEVSGF